MDPSRLWAKGLRRNQTAHPSMLLINHLVDVHTSARLVLQATGKDQLRALGLDPELHHFRFEQCVLLAAAVHDLGKANDHFQGMILGKRDVRANPQGLRHEWVTVLLVQQLKSWLLPAVGGNELDLAIVEWAVAGHHPAADHPSPPRLCPPGAGVSLLLQVTHPDFQTILNWLRGKAFQIDLGPPPTLATQAIPLTGADNVFGTLAKWMRAAQRLWERLKKSPESRLVAAVKNCLIAADIAGSALPKPGAATNWKWIIDSFEDRPKAGDLAEVVRFRLGTDKPREFQKAVAASKAGVTFVKAGCGSGKTVAAYMWARDNYPTRRLYFCYPTTGTATEGFRDYLFDESEKTPRVGAALFHGRSDIDFELILHTGNDGQQKLEEQVRHDSLRAWKTPIVACTVDTVLGIVQNNRRGLYSWPALAQSAFVFDEIHAYDDRLFGALLRFIRDLPGLPVLLMTASLPSARRNALEETVAMRKQESLITIKGPAELEERRRYRRIDNVDPVAVVREVLATGKKVLWVCNTVQRVMQTAKELDDLKLLIYHSRFKYEDRVNRHADVINAFKGQGPALAICSQVAELSLDLSADLLVTDIATVPAIIQRLGRLNRRAKEGDPTKPFLVIEPENHLPYTPADLADARTWLARLPEEISQKDLSDRWEQTGEGQPDLVASAWLDGGPITSVTELRDASPGITVLMEADRDRVQAKPSELARLVLPMPPTKLQWQEWQRERGLPVAPNGTIDYDPKRGATWRE